MDSHGNGQKDTILLFLLTLKQNFTLLILHKPRFCHLYPRCGLTDGPQGEKLSYRVARTHLKIFSMVNICSAVDFQIESRPAAPGRQCSVECRGYFVCPSVFSSVHPFIHNHICWPGVFGPHIAFWNDRKFKKIKNQIIVWVCSLFFFIHLYTGSVCNKFALSRLNKKMALDYLKKLHKTRPLTCMLWGPVGDP